MSTKRSADSSARLPESGISRIIIVIVVVVVIGLLAFVLLQGRSSKDTNTPGNTNSPVTTNLDTRIILPISDVDTDGLSDNEESELGTDPSKADTDTDELTDLNEVKVYHSDPLKSDTDGDGFSDGQEVKQGFDPAGPGKLFEPNPQATNPQ